MENIETTVYFLGTAGGGAPVVYGDGGKINEGKSFRFNGGNKAVNLWVNFLNYLNIESYYVPNPQNEISPWLVNHCSTIGTFDMLLNFNREKDILILTWLDYPQYEFLAYSQLPFIYLDLEYRYTNEFYRWVDLAVKLPSFKGYVTHANHIKEYVSQNWSIKASVVEEWSDPNIFYYNSDDKITNSIGYTLEENTLPIINKLKSHPYFEKYTFIEVTGEEKDFSKLLRSCDYFLGTNLGKYINKNNHPEEGCPRTQQEALHCGCILLAHDTIGNREYLKDKHSGFFVDFNRIEDVVSIFSSLEDNNLKENIRKNGLEIIQKYFSPNNYKKNQILNILNLKK